MNVGEASRPIPCSYRQSLAWLYSLQLFGIKLGLENIRQLINGLDITTSGAFQITPGGRETVGPGRVKVIHVAGTNGKGSVCAMLEAICRAQGYSTGLFTSPHLVTFRERIRVNGEMISEEKVASNLTTIREFAVRLDPHPTFFEVTTAVALKHFAEADVDIVILETGLGGRLDATNAVASNVAVITPIDMDHQKWLGDSLAKIATEKAGIIKSKTPVVSWTQKPEAEKVIRGRASECEAPIQIVSEPYQDSPISLRGSHQRQNAALAIAALRTARIELDESAIARGLASVEWPARFQCWDERTIIDGAHNPAAAHVLAEAWRENFKDQRATLILALLSDKDALGICQALAPISEFVFLPHIRSARALAPEQLADAVTSTIPSLPYSITPSIAVAVDSARARSGPILITGSLHFAGEALAHLQGRPGAFEECAQ